MLCICYRGEGLEERGKREIHVAELEGGWALYMVRTDRSSSTQCFFSMHASKAVGHAQGAPGATPLGDGDETEDGLGAMVGGREFIEGGGEKVKVSKVGLLE